MGRVYQVVDESLNATFALKMVLTSSLTLAGSERFRNEARAMVELDHPNILRIYSYDEFEGIPYFTMKYLSGGTLAAKEPSGRLPLREAIALMHKVASAIAYLHERGLVHRDLKPQNILLDEAGEPYVSDFGLVKSHGELDPEPVGKGPAPSAANDSARAVIQLGRLTEAGAVMGTRAYMAPEQAAGDLSAVGARSDVWSLGVILHELVLGTRPFEPSDHDELTHPVSHAALAPPTESEKSIDRTLEAIILKCLEKDPGQRCSAAELRDELDRWLNPVSPKGQPSLARRLRWPAAALAVGLIIGIVWTTWPRAGDRLKDGSPPTVDQRRADLRAMLASGQTVKLIDADGKLRVPLTYWINEEHARSLAVGDACTFDSTLITYVELLDDVGIPNYEFQVQVKCTQQATRPTGGLYVSHERFDSDAMVSHFLIELRHTDPTKPGEPFRLVKANGVDGKAPVFKGADEKEPKALDGLREVNLRRISVPQPSGQPRTVRHQVDLPERAIPARGFAGPDWRTLGVRTTSRAFVLRWDGNDLATIPRPVPRAWRDPLFIRFLQPMDRDVVFVKPGGLGLIVQGGLVSFRDAEIRPLAAE
jgi:serine/threonine-protein kinase